MILSAGLSPAWQQILSVETLRVGEVNRASQAVWCASGKVLNVGIALAHLGGTSRTISVLGGSQADRIQREFAELAAPARWVRVAAPTRICTTVLDARSGQTTELVENAGTLTAEEIEDFVAAYEEDVTQAEMVVLTGSLPRGTPATFYSDLLAKTKCPTILDFRGKELEAALVHKPLVVKPNREELGQTVGRVLENEDDLRRAMHEVADRGAQWVVVSDGGGPLRVASPSEFLRFQPPKIQVVNPIGCGDCLAAGLAWALRAGRDMPAAARFGIAAAAENATMLLPGRLDPAQVEARAKQVEQVS